MKEQAPIAIRYIADQKGVFWGWSVRGLEQINPYTLRILSPESAANSLAKGERLVDVVHVQVQAFFNGSLSADLNIPPNYPYEFYEPEKNIPTYTGRLRESISPSKFDS